MTGLFDVVLPPKILTCVIITYGACTRGGGRRPGFEATRINERDQFAWAIVLLNKVLWRINDNHVLMV